MHWQIATRCQWHTVSVAQQDVRLCFHSPGRWDEADGFCLTAEVTPVLSFSLQSCPKSSAGWVAQQDSSGSREAGLGCCPFKPLPGVIVPTKVCIISRPNWKAKWNFQAVCTFSDLLVCFSSVVSLFLLLIFFPFPLPCVFIPSSCLPGI